MPCSERDPIYNYFGGYGPQLMPNITAVYIKDKVAELSSIQRSDLICI